MADSLSKEQRRRVISYLKKAKPEGWRNLLEAMNNGPAWKQFGLYYECVRFGSVSDCAFFERWSIRGQMSRLPPIATQSQQGLTDFLLKIRQSKLQESSVSSEDHSSEGASQCTLGKASTSVTSSPKSTDQSSLKPTIKEKKRTISMMIEPSLYDEVKRLADLKERSVGAQIRHSLKQAIRENSDVLGYNDRE